MERPIASFVERHSTYMKPMAKLRNTTQGIKSNGNRDTTARYKS
jgi:hypothetical protein